MSEYEVNENLKWNCKFGKEVSLKTQVLWDESLYCWVRVLWRIYAECEVNGNLKWNCNFGKEVSLKIQVLWD